MAVFSLSKVVEALPDVQVMGGDVILHYESKNVVIGKMMADELISCTPFGDSLVQSDNTSTVTKPRAKKAKGEADLDLGDL